METAVQLGKRILPIVCRPLEGASPPPRLRDLNWTYFYDDPKAAPGAGFGSGFAKLVEALNTDFGWLRAHTRYLQRAMEWDAGGRPADRLLSGNDILEAKAWAARRPKGAPEPTALQLDFIRASEEEAKARLSERRKQLEEVAAAQAERERALQKQAEALEQAADAQRRRTRIRNIALVAVGSLAAVAVLFALFANQQRQQADDLLARGTNIIAKIQGRMDIETKKEAFALFQAGAKRGDATTMYNLGVFYEQGYGVPRDYAKAREWYEKAAAKDDEAAMYNLGVFYEKGYGVPQDYTKAREWYEKAAAKDVAFAMHNLGVFYDNGYGVPQDYTKAREWYEKAAAKDNADAKTALEELAIREAETAGRYAEALHLQDAFEAKLEAEEMERYGKPDKQVATELNYVAWLALFAKKFTKGLTVADHAHTLFPNDLSIETNRAHALMFLGHDEEAKGLYLTHKGEPVSEADNTLWEQAIAEDFEKFRKAGLTKPMMADIEKELGISR